MREVLFLFVAVGVFCGCVQETSVSKLPSYIDGVEGELLLSDPVVLPIDQDTAYMLNNLSGCMCEGKLFYSGGYWVMEDAGSGVGCQFKVDRKTGEVICVRVY